MHRFVRNDFTEVGGSLRNIIIYDVILTHNETISLFHMIIPIENYCNTSFPFRFLMRCFLVIALREVIFVGYVMIMFSRRLNKLSKSIVCGR